MYDRILVPTDGGTSAEAAMEHAIGLAERFDAEILLLHVVDTRHYDTSIESAVEPLERRGERYLDRLLALAEGTAVPAITAAIERGRPARVILAYAAANDADLVVMGTRGEGGLARRLLGSVTEYVVTHAHTPVHVVPTVDEHEHEQEHR
jgi:nucleotide-binding universal stress UspA family protein